VAVGFSPTEAAVKAAAVEAIVQLAAIATRVKPELPSAIRGGAPDVSAPSRPSVTLPTEATTRPASPLEPSPPRFTVGNIFGDPQVLRGASLHEVYTELGVPEGWRSGVMQRSQSRPEGGWTLREVSKRGGFTDRYIQYHPGTPRHFGGAPYWKVSSGKTRVVRIPARLR
jgi:hypothetical protein